ncbi:UDP-N-acetylglucosamine 4,6-dehydratase family protein [Peredibacter sp. HCB2-198]|uniref:UDP-N-acetylglucosamine 4,6-dehydratase family protein n=1 Tax=Peredibacter sp. HCB2-198 TaxID=3383025 RepID=UPI0038B5E57A
MMDLKNLLNRPPVEVDLGPVAEQLQNKIVMVTGGGGSIGSELCRQIIQMRPLKLLILDHSELNLYKIDSELRERNFEVEIVSILADIKELHSLIKIFHKYSPDYVYHAAAYKHVHLVESNPYSSIVNNVLGTKNLIDCSIDFQVKTFVMVSTDKAVNPVSIMGATKRICEMLITEAAEKSGRRFCSVRFGNVLGSSGSLIPLLEKQVLSGGPVTITHPDMMRYFMLISEAVKLVLKAGQLSNPGDVYILKMGPPVKVIEMARKVIQLLGKTEEEIPIIFTEIRPGEKLFEELYLVGNETLTEHEDILVLPHRSIEKQNLELIQEIVKYAFDENEKALELLRILCSKENFELKNNEGSSSEGPLFGKIQSWNHIEINPLPV